MSVTKITNNAYYLEEKQALVVFSGEPSANLGSIKPVMLKGIKDKVDVKYWGEKNLQPQERELLVSDNNIVGSLIGTKRDITLGGGIMAFRERFEKGEKGGMKRIIDEIEMPTVAEEFFDKSDINNYLLGAAADLMFHANIFTEFVRNKGGQIDSIMHQRCSFIRAEKQDSTGFIRNYFRSGWWHKPSDKDAITYQIPNYVKDKKQAKFLYHAGDHLLNDGYYNIPTWWGGRTWIELANAIAQFHKSNLKNGFNLRYLIEVDEDYFKDNTYTAQTPEAIAEAGMRQDEARVNFTNTITDSLSGVENAGNTIFTEMKKLPNGQQYSNVKITPIPADMKDEALIRLFEASNAANISAQAIHPTLAAIETAGKLSSGTEIRNAFLMYLAIKTPLPRKILLEPIEIIKRENGWEKGIKFGFRDIELTALSEDKSGAKESNIVK